MINLSMQAITQIAQAEAEADKIVFDANQKAKAIVSSAQEESQKTFEKAVQTALLKSKELCEDARKEASEQSQKFAQVVEKECEELRVSTRDRIEGAVASVVEKVVKSR